MVFRKVFANELQKTFADVCLYVHTVRWIEPNYVSLSVLAATLCGVSCWFLAGFLVVSASFKCAFVVWFGFVKEFIV